MIENIKGLKRKIDIFTGTKTYLILFYIMNELLVYPIVGD